jgi:hypothetical protein
MYWNSRFLIWEFFFNSFGFNTACIIPAFKIAPSGKNADFKMSVAQLFFTVDN